MTSIPEQPDVLEHEGGPECPYCHKISKYIGDISWYYSWHTCEHCGRNYLAKTDVHKNPKNVIYITKRCS